MAAYMAMGVSGPRLISLSEMAPCLEPSHFPAIVDCIAQGFVEYSKGNVSVAPIQTMGQPPLAPWTAALQDKTNAGWVVSRAGWSRVSQWQVADVHQIRVCNRGSAHGG